MDDSIPAQPERERAIDLAYKAIGRRERTEAELRTFLERKRVEPDAIEEAVATLEAGGFLDDARYALRFAEDKRSLESWGAERIARELHRRGVAPEHVERALADWGREDELAAALELLGRRMPAAARDDRDRERAWRLLVRRGYEPDIAYEAVRAHDRRAA
jgi:regulatory protein